MELKTTEIEFKRVPKTSIDKYISGWESLNLKLNKSYADWHPMQYWVSIEKSREIELYSNLILGEDGVNKLKVPYSNEPVYVAIHSRALADLVYTATINKKSLNPFRKEYNSLLNEEETIEYRNYLNKMAEEHEEIDEFLKTEFPKWYYRRNYK